jgi:hypothetical protein
MAEKNETAKSDFLKNELLIPPAAASDPKAFELVRAWIAQGELHVSMQMGGWDDPTAWGVVLADLVRDAMEAELDGEEEPPEGGRVQ